MNNNKDIVLDLLEILKFLFLVVVCISMWYIIHKDFTKQEQRKIAAGYYNMSFEDKCRYNGDTPRKITGIKMASKAHGLFTGGTIVVYTSTTGDFTEYEGLQVGNTYCIHTFKR